MIVEILNFKYMILPSLVQLQLSVGFGQLWSLLNLPTTHPQQATMQPLKTLLDFLALYAFLMAQLIENIINQFLAIDLLNKRNLWFISRPVNYIKCPTIRWQSAAAIMVIDKKLHNQIFNYTGCSCFSLLKFLPSQGLFLDIFYQPFFCRFKNI